MAPLVFHAPRREEQPLEKSWDKSAAVTEAMGNKSSAPPKGPDTGSARDDEAAGAVAGQISTHPDDLNRRGSSA